MIDDQVILTIERLRDRLVELNRDLRGRYGRESRQVNNDSLRKAAAGIAEAWMVDIAPRPEVSGVIPSDYFATLNVHFQRLLTLSEHASLSSRYTKEIKSILNNFTVQFIIPLKQRRAGVSAQTAAVLITNNKPKDFSATAFVGMSFEPADKIINDVVLQTLDLIGITAITGGRPRAERISEKVKSSIDNQYMFIGVFTCRDKVSKKKEWTTSPWVIDEKAYAVGKGKKLILLKEKGIGSIGGIQGDYEYIEFSRDRLHELSLGLLKIFNHTVKGLQS